MSPPSSFARADRPSRQDARPAHPTPRRIASTSQHRNAAASDRNTKNTDQAARSVQWPEPSALRNTKRRDALLGPDAESPPPSTKPSARATDPAAIRSSK